MNCVHGTPMELICKECYIEEAQRRLSAAQAKPYQTDKVEAIEFAEIPEMIPLPHRPAIDAENSMAVATRELAESIAHLAPAVSALAAAYAGNEPTEFREVPIHGPVTDAEVAATCGYFGWTYAHMGDRVRNVLTAFAAGRGLL